MFWRLRRAVGNAATLRILPYLWYHKVRFGITNTKFDISFCVFEESFLNDQYGIKKFLSQIEHSSQLTFLDLGRNHGLVFYYAMHHIMTHKIPMSRIDYIGIDPAPLKFVYFNHHDYLRDNGIAINYLLMQKAIVFDGSESVKLKYGEGNFGNFNVAGSNYDRKLKALAARREFVEIEVETMQAAQIYDFIEAGKQSDTLIVKIDCKNRTEVLFAEALARLEGAEMNYLVACEQDGSAERDLSHHAVPGQRVLRASNLPLA